MSAIVKIENKGPHRLGLLLFNSDGAPNGEPEIILHADETTEFCVHDGKRPYLYAMADIEAHDGPAKFCTVPPAYASCSEIRTKPEKWVVHIVGPDDVIECRNEIDALRRANQHNKQFAKIMGEDHSPNDPYCVALAKNISYEIP